MAFRNLTNVGKEYLATRLANELPVKFIKAKIGNGSVPLLVNPADTKDLYNFKKEVTIIEAVQEQNSIKLTLQVTNNEILEGFYLKEIGIYADDNGKEVLYWYCNEDNSQYINAQTDVPLSFEIDIMMEVTNINSTVIEWAGKENWISKNYFDEKVRTFEIPTIAELQSRKNLKVGDIVEVLGYYTAGDRAGHKRIIANEDDGSGVELKNGLWANIVHNGEVNVSWFGAKGDGVTDDTEIFQKILNYKKDEIIEINIDKEIFVEKIQISKNKILTGRTLNAVQIKLDREVTIKDINLQPRATDENTPFLLIDGNTLSRGFMMVNINIRNITIPKRIEQIHRDFCCIDIGENVGIFGITFDGIYGSELTDFDTVFKIKLHKSKKNLNKMPWLTYLQLRNITMLGSKTMISTLAYYDEDNDEYKGMYLLEDTKKAAAHIKIRNCHFESQGRAETFMRLSNRIHGLHIDKNSFIGDYLEYDSGRNNKKKYYIIDCRGNFEYYNNDLQLPSSFIENNCEEYIPLLGYEPSPLNSYTYPLVDFSSSMNKYKPDYLISKDTERINLSIMPWEGRKVYLILSRYNYDTYATYILHGAKTNDGTVGTFSLALISNNKYRFTTNITNLKKISVYKSEAGDKYYVLELTANNNFGSENSRVMITSFVEKYVYNIYSVIQGTTHEEADKEFKKLSLSLIQEVEKELPLNLINTPYHVEKMKTEGVYNDFIAYMDEKTVYDKKQQQLEQKRQLAYEQALKENPNLSYEEFMSLQPMTLNLIEEPQPSKALQDFMKKYL